MKFLYVSLVSCLWLVQGNVLKKGYFWQVTDFHYDANYSVNGNPSNMCHKGGSTSFNNSIFGNYLCDSPMKLIESAINAMKTIHADPDFILWTGDSVPHVKDSELNPTKVYYNIGNVTEQLVNMFPNTSIYPVLGNHDEYPKDGFPPGNTKYYSDILSICGWSQILGQKESEQFKKGGYYKSETKTGLVILGLNTNMYYGFDPLTNGSADPAGQFNWLEEQLKQLETSNKKVILISHIPPGFFELSSGLMWFYKIFNEKYISLVSKYSNIISAQIYGHEHTDSFRILNDDNGNPVGVLFLSPAVTPWKSTLPGVGSNNPSIRLYEYNQQTGEILDYHQYYLNLSAVLSTNIDKWEKEYSAKEDYKLNSMNAVSFVKAARSFKNTPALFKKYLQFNSVSQTISPECDKTCQKVHFCSITELRTENFNECLNIHPGPHIHSTTTPMPKKTVSRNMIIIICVLAGVFFISAVIVAILCLRKHTVFIPHRYSRFSTPLSKGPIN